MFQLYYYIIKRNSAPQQMSYASLCAWKICNVCHRRFKIATYVFFQILSQKFIVKTSSVSYAASSYFFLPSLFISLSIFHFCQKDIYLHHMTYHVQQCVKICSFYEKAKRRRSQSCFDMLWNAIILRS